MDIALLVKLLAPCLPFLAGLGQKAAEKGAEKLGEQGATELLPQAKKIWEKLHPKVQVKAATREAVADVAKDADDADALAALRRQLKKILEAPENAALAVEIAEILAEVEEYSTGAAKFNVRVKDSQVGVIGDHTTVTMNISSKTHE
ncbi:MAG: hypothetical protein HC769_34835 [Cyanobacteria bacterium CRU_2_1]|nr:hypothetical protein [Leptolyngbyaceae cyanobacterium SU_3_3]NJR63504.1 hypothetical protein [Cyanobacteria bacterium CRU_2_1]